MAKASDVIKIAQSWVGFGEANGKFKEILDVYNTHKPLARGYPMKTTDDWCDAFVSACAIKANAVDIIGTEVGVPKHVDIFRQKGIWNDDGRVIPKPGWIIVYAWGKHEQPNDAWPKHIGIVEKVEGRKITTIEGNYANKVKRRTIAVGHGNIRGYGMPKYEAETTAKKNIDEIAKQVIAGKWGNGQERIDRLTKAGYNYKEIQNRVNSLLK